MWRSQKLERQQQHDASQSRDANSSRDDDSSRDVSSSMDARNIKDQEDSWDFETAGMSATVPAEAKSQRQYRNIMKSWDTCKCVKVNNSMEASNVMEASYKREPVTISFSGNTRQNRSKGGNYQKYHNFYKNGFFTMIYFCHSDSYRTIQKKGLCC
jgi:hypothetical protein